MNIVNRYGRTWDELDSLKVYVHIQGAFCLVSEDGFPLCGRVIENQPVTHYIALNWRALHRIVGD